MPTSSSTKIQTFTSPFQPELSSFIDRNVLVVGNHDSGKTTLLKRFAGLYITRDSEIFVLDTVSEHPTKSLICQLDAPELSKSIVLENTVVPQVSEYLNDYGKLIRIDLSPGLEASNKEGLSLEAKRLLREKHIDFASTLLLDVLNVTNRNGKEVVIISDEVDYRNAVLASAIDCKYIRIVMVPNSYEYSDVGFDDIIELVR